MARLLHRRLLRGKALRLAAAVAVVYAVLVPAYGPMLSPSFAELLPNHTHVHLNGYAAHHLHSYDHIGAPGGTDAGSGGTLALPSTGDGSAAGIAVPVTFAALLTAASAAALVLLTAPPAARLRGLATRAETPPPRPLSLSA